MILWITYYSLFLKTYVLNHTRFQMITTILVLCLFQFVYGIPIVEQGVRDQLIRHYFNIGYTYNEIIGFLLCIHGIAVSLPHLKRILRRMGLRKNNNAKPLIEIVQRIMSLHRQGFFNLGYRAMWTLLNGVCKIRATQASVRNILKVISPDLVVERSRHRLHRRIYYNKGPNYLIHIDGYDKLKPFGIAIHGGIDGYSRKILWLKAANTNNNPKVVARYYMDYIRGMQRLPRVVRADAGTENVIIRELQIFLRRYHTDEMHGEKSFQTGTSTSNQRIEMLWSFLMKTFTHFWRSLFKDLRDSGFINDSNAFTIYCLRFCFLPLIQQRLDLFMGMWNSHRIRSQRHSEVPCGIPDVLFYQPLMCGDRDCSLSLPFQSDNKLHILNDFCTEAQTERGCPEEFWRELEHLSLCEVPLEELERLVPTNVTDALRLYGTLISIFDP